jgi:hypothetical protein
MKGATESECQRRLSKACGVKMTLALHLIGFGGANIVRNLNSWWLADCDYRS